MSDEIRVAFNGLVTDPSAIVAGASAITKAQNVVFRGEGIIEPLGLFFGNACLDASTDGYTETTHARQWPDGRVTHACTNLTDTRVYLTPAAPSITIATDTELLRSEQLGTTQCWTFPPCLRVMDSSNSSAPFVRLPGAPRPALRNTGYVYVTGTGTGLTVDRTYGYRVVVKRKLDTSNGTGTTFRELYSAPSDRYLVPVRAGTTTPAAIKLEVPIGSIGIQLNDEIQIYRTRTAGGSSTTDPGDEMDLRYAYTVAAGDVAAGYWSFTDSLPDGEWAGPTLYTSSSQQGLLRSNYRVRIASDIALYEGKACYAGASAGWQHSMTLKSMGDTQNPQESIVSAFCSTAVTWVSGFKVVSGIPAAMFPYLAAGQLVTGQGVGADADPHSGANTLGCYGKIVTINAGAGTITLDTNMTANNAGLHGFVAWDWIGMSKAATPAVASQVVYASWVDPVGAYIYSHTNGSYVFAVNPTAAVSATAVAIYGGPALEACMARNFTGASDAVYGRVLRLYTVSGTPLTRGIELIAEYDATVDATGNCDIVNALTFAIVSCKPKAFSVAVGKYLGESPTQATLTGFGGAELWFSKLWEFEAIPVGNRIVVGNPSIPISRIIATTDRLWILKPDGLFIMQGAGDDTDSVAITQFDPTFRMLSGGPLGGLRGTDGSNFATKLGDSVFALTRRGVARIDASGVSYIDAAIATDIRALTAPSNIYGGITPFKYTHMFASDREGLVVLGGSMQNLCHVEYVYNVANDTWSTIDLSQLLITSGGVSADGTFIYGIRGGGYGTYQGIPALNSSYLVDQMYTVSSGGECITVEGEDVTVGALAVLPWIGEAYSDYTEAGVTYQIQSVVGTTVTFEGTTAVGPIPVGTVFLDSAGAYYRVIATSGSYVATVDRTGMATGLPLLVFYPHSTEVRFGATTQGTPYVEKFARKTTVSFRRIRSGTKFDMSWRARNKPASTVVSETIIYDDPAAATYPTFMTDHEWSIARSVPTEATRFTGLETTVSFDEACVYFALDSFTLQTREYTDRIEGRQ